MHKKEVEIAERDLGKQPLSVEELNTLIGDQDYRMFLNSRNELYRKMNMKTNPPPRGKAIELMAQQPNLIKRPILHAGRKLYLGYDERVWKKEL